MIVQTERSLGYRQWRWEGGLGQSSDGMTPTNVFLEGLPIAVGIEQGGSSHDTNVDASRSAKCTCALPMESSQIAAELDASICFGNCCSGVAC